VSEEREHVAARLREALATDRRVGEIELELEVDLSEVVVRGTVPTEERRQAIAEVLADAAPDLRLRNEVTVASHREPRDEEALP
jgi:hypothetical protein